MKAAACFLILAAFALPESRKYISPDQSFEFSVPDGYDLYTGRDKPGGSYIPVCQDPSIVCAVFPGNQYKGTTFEAASFEVTLLDAETANACTTHVSGALIKPSKIISGVRFTHGFMGAGAMSTDIATNYYRGFKDGRCYLLETHVTYGNFAAYDPGVIKEFTKRDVKRVTGELTRILDTFRILH